MPYARIGKPVDPAVKTREVLTRVPTKIASKSGSSLSEKIEKANEYVAGRFGIRKNEMGKLRVFREKELATLILETPGLLHKINELRHFINLIGGGFDDTDENKHMILGVLGKKEVLELLKTNPDLVINALYGLSSSARGRRILKEIAYGRDRPLTSKFITELKKFDDIGADEASMFFFRYYYSRDRGEKETAYARRMELMRELATLNKNFGIEFFERYDPELIDQAYKMAVDSDYQKEKPLALVIFNKSDPSGAFESKRGAYTRLLDGYRVIIAECRRDDYALATIRNIKEKYGELDLLVLGGHGKPTSLALGILPLEDEFEGDYIDIRDFQKFGGKGGLEKYFNEGAKICLLSCSTGKEIKTHEDEFGNLMEMIGKLSNREVLAPDDNAVLRRFVFDEERRVVGIKWWWASSRTYKAKEYSSSP